MDHADHVGLLRAASSAGRRRGPTSGRGRARSRWPSPTCSVPAGGSSPSIGMCGALARERGGRPFALPGDVELRDARRRPDRAAGPARARRPRRGQQPPLRPARPPGGGHPAHSPRTCGRAGGSSSSSTTPTAAIRGCRTRSATASWERWPIAAGLDRHRLIGRVPSRFLGAIYAAVSRRRAGGGRP